jgi:Arc/MetJ family transcription regulator
MDVSQWCSERSECSEKPPQLWAALGPVSTPLLPSNTSIHLRVYDVRQVEEGAVSTTRTNIELDDDLVEAAMRLYGTRSKKATVDLALRRLVGARLSMDEAIAMEGSGWEGDLDRMRADSPPHLA